MTFPKRLLAEHETLVFDLRPHWIALAPSVLWTLVLLVVGLLGYGLASDHLSDPGVVQNVFVIMLLIAWAILAGYPFLKWRTTNFVLTGDRLITRAGIIAKGSREIPLENINDVAFHQSILERALGAGDLLVESAGERGQSTISNIRKPEQVQLQIYKAMETNGARVVSAGYGVIQAQQSGREQSIPEQIEALARLKERGVLSSEEFEAKKSDLLSRM